MWCVYCVFHVVTGRVYVGKAQNPMSRWRSHILHAKAAKTHFHRAMKLYGVDAFEMHVLQWFKDENVALEAEKYWIQYWDATESSCGFNMTTGGDGVTPTKEVRKRMSDAQRKRFDNESYEERQQRIKKHVQAARSGTQNPAAKLSNDQLALVRKRLMENVSVKLIADELGVRYRVVQNIKHGHSYNETRITS